MTYQSPVSRLEEWDDIAEMLSRSFGNPGTRPYDIDPSSEAGRRISELFRMKLEKADTLAAQVATRRSVHCQGSLPHLYNDGSKAVETEDLSLVRHPKQRFTKPVRCGILVYGHLIADELQDRPLEPQAPVPGLPTDVSFPDLSPQVPVEVRRSIARAHINLGHPTAQELIRMATASGSPSSLFIEAIRKLKCSTCERLKGPQAPRPATATINAFQFGDRVEVDIFYLRDLQGRSCMILGAVDVATRFHQAGFLRSREPQDAYDVLDNIWLKPFGLMTQIALDPDTTFQGAFQERLRSHGVMVDYCAAEAHWQIGHVERQNAFLRTVMEKLVDTFAATSVTDIKLLLAPVLHAVNSMTLSRGRSAFQAVFGRVPRLPGGLLTDFNVLTATPTDDPAATVEIIRSEALKTLYDLNVRQSMRRAILRKTRDAKVPQLQPGQACSFWRWRKKGLKKRGGWITARFLSWDPASPSGKMAWVRSGTTTALVAVEQLRAATGFEAWLPTEPDVAALKDASQTLDQALWTDETGPAPDQRQQADDAEMPDLDALAGKDLDMAAALTSASSLPAAAASSSTPPPVETSQVTLDVDQTVQNLVYQPTVQNTFVRNVARLGDPSAGARRGASIPRTPRGTSAPRTPRSRSPAPPARPVADTRAEELQEPQAQLPQELPEPPVPDGSQTRAEERQEPAQLPEELPEPPVPEVPVPETPLEPGWESAPFSSAAYESEAEPEPLQPAELEQLFSTTTGARGRSTTGSTPLAASSGGAPGQEAASADSTSSVRPPTTPVTSEPSAQEGGQPSLLPAKRPFEALTTFFLDEGELYHCTPGNELTEGYGPKEERCYKAYLNSKHRLDDVKNLDKQAADSDTSDSDWSDVAPSTEKRGMTRAEAKALDREIPWRQILDMDPADIKAYVAATEKEAKSWLEWGSVKPLSHTEAQSVLRDKVLAKRVLRTRSCFRDKNKGMGQLAAKCRVVALGHRDPDIYRLNRECATPNRTSEHILFIILTSGSNSEFADSKKKWFGWAGDASTAFLQGDLSDAERELPLYLLPPKDGVTALTSCWKAPLYLVCTNVYGLSNAPRLWSLRSSSG